MSGGTRMIRRGYRDWYMEMVIIGRLERIQRL